MVESGRGHKVRDGEGAVAGTRGACAPQVLYKKKPRHLNQVAGFWRRPTDSRVPTRFARYLRELDRLPAGFPARRVLCSSRRHQKNTRRSFDLRVLCSGDVLLSHGLSPYYHRGCSVSLPCSEWERVGPLRYCHQKFAPRSRDKFLVAALRAA